MTVLRASESAALRVRRVGVRLVVASVVFVGTFGTFGSLASGDLWWTPPVTVSDPAASASHPNISGDRAGAVTVWVSGSQQTLLDDHIQAAVFDGVRWSAPHDISAPGASLGVVHSVVGDNHSAVAAWSLYDGSTSSVQAATFDGSSWSTPITLAFNEGLIDLSGTGTGAIALLRNASGLVTAAFDGTTWSPVVSLTLSSSFLYGSSVSGTNSSAVAIWSSASSVLAATFDGATWSAPVVVSTPGVCSVESSVIGNNTRALAIWVPFGGCTELAPRGVVMAAAFDGVSWSPPIAISAVGVFEDQPDIDLTGTPGRAVAAWERLVDDGGGGGLSGYIEAATFDGASWSPPTVLSVSGCNAPAVDGSSAGATAAWIDCNTTSVQTATFDGSSWSTPATISSHYAHEPDVVDPNGAVAVWFAVVGGQFVVEASVGTPAAAALPVARFTG